LKYIIKFGEKAIKTSIILKVNKIIGNPLINGVSFCGSSRAGSILSSIAGKHLKKSVMELGGCDPFLVLPDADVDLAVSLALKSRLANAGQVCFSAKRFLIGYNKNLILMARCFLVIFKIFYYSAFTGKMVS
jgi:acyl-CoA reductase-like NAD-dependent aldehyde dehydrogenase